MLEPDDSRFTLEFDGVERTLEVTVTLRDGETRIRIEALRTKGGTYSTAAYIQR